MLAKTEPEAALLAGGEVGWGSAEDLSPLLTKTEPETALLAGGEVGWGSTEDLLQQAEPGILHMVLLLLQKLAKRTQLSS